MSSNASQSPDSSRDGNEGGGAAADSGLGTGAGAGGAPHIKRTRVLLSCKTCRNSKLKCDRGTPCGQCLKKGRPEMCEYAPRPQKQKPPKSMAARLKRLEGMVRGMIDIDPSEVDHIPAAAVAAREEAGGAVVKGQNATSYVGGTHFMAILEDLEDLKNYFEDDEDEAGESPSSAYEGHGSPDFVLAPRTTPISKEELLASMPDKVTSSRLVNRYFNSNSPSSQILHKPTFMQQYAQFQKDPSRASLAYIALIYMVFSLGVFFSRTNTPHPPEGDSPLPSMDRFHQYRAAAGWALVTSKYTNPTSLTLQAFLLYCEADFINHNMAHVNCYMTTSVLIRLMMKMGLHRDPSKLPNITPFDGEMRRRMWNLAIQIDLLVAFHLGLPSMIQGIESDTALPHNLVDTDFSEHSELPPPRPVTDYTQMSYPIQKATLSRVFSDVAKHAHALSVPPYAETMRLDAKINQTWEGLPDFMRIKPLDECITDPAHLVIQRFGLASLYHKSRCVLHRRYLTNDEPKMEHDYSRVTCLDAALALLEYQHTIHEATQPGCILFEIGWFLSPMAVYDYLLAAMVLALVIQTERYWGPDGIVWMSPSPTKEDLLNLLIRSRAIWQELSHGVSDAKKPRDILQKVIDKIRAYLGLAAEPGTVRHGFARPSHAANNMSPGTIGSTNSHSTAYTSGTSLSMPNGFGAIAVGMPAETASMASLNLQGSNGNTTAGWTPATDNSDHSHRGVLPTPNFTDFEMMDVHTAQLLGTFPPAQMNPVNATGNNGQDSSWMGLNEYDWNNIDAFTRGDMELTGQVLGMDGSFDWSSRSSN